MQNEYLVLAGIVISSYLTYLGTTYKFRKQKPKDPAAQLFEYYEQMLKNVWEQSTAKDALIDKLEKSLDNIQSELWETKQLLSETKLDLAEANRRNEEIQRHMLEARVAMKHH